MEKEGLSGDNTYNPCVKYLDLGFRQENGEKGINLTVLPKS